MTPEQILLSGIQAKKQQADQAPELAKAELRDQVQKLINAQAEATKVMVKFLQHFAPDVTVKNFPAFPESIKTPDTQEVVNAVKGLEQALKPTQADNSDIVKAVKSLASKIEAIPATESVEVSNLAELKSSISGDLKALLEAIKSLEVSPQITLPAPVVTVQKPDLKAISTGLDKIYEGVKEFHVPAFQVDTDPLINFLPVDIDDAGLVQYFGYVNSIGGWYIRKFDTSTSPKTIRFAFGSGTYDFSARAGYSYTIWGQ